MIYVFLGIIAIGIIFTVYVVKKLTNEV